MKYKILRADSLVKQIEYELEHRNSNDVFSTQKDMEASAKSYLDIASKEETNYYNYYKEKFCLISSVNNSEEKTQDVSNDKNSKKATAFIVVFLGN